MVAGTKYVGSLEEKLKKILDEASKDKTIILFIDEIHQTIGGGKSEK
ncbi:MAG: AAA family ATPase [Clostridium sp.]|nr:MAG: AAA family ATPase [Clostridium sp.]